VLIASPFRFSCWSSTMPGLEIPARYRGVYLGLAWSRPDMVERGDCTVITLVHVENGAMTRAARYADPIGRHVEGIPPPPESSMTKD
jgi:hypothetical protein